MKHVYALVMGRLRCAVKILLIVVSFVVLCFILTSEKLVYKNGIVNSTITIDTLKYQDPSCLISIKQYLIQITQKREAVPLLLSFQKHITVKHKHTITGKTFLVPNIVHVISFGAQQPFMFFNYVAFKSYQKYMQPHAIFLWGDLEFGYSHWWNKTLEEVANIYFVKTKPLHKIGGTNVIYAAHSADILRLQILRGSY